MELSGQILLILAACLLDALFGDPVYPLHPVRLIGAWSQVWERRLFAMGLDGRFGGLLHWLVVVGGAILAWLLGRLLLAQIHPWLPPVWDLYIAWSLLCMRDLLEHGQRVLAALHDLPLARKGVAMLVGRDTEHLERAGIVRATIESLSENLTDGVLTPLWAFCLLGLPGLILVKAVSSLDSMVGYRNARYERFGWAGARSDDLLNWLPARLSVPLIALAAALLRLYPLLAFRAAWTYHAMLPSPNSGWSEAACAGALRVRLVGPIRYGGALVTESFMGDPDWPSELNADHLRQALRLMLVACLIAIMLGLIITGSQILSVG